MVGGEGVNFDVLMALDGRENAVGRCQGAVAYVAYGDVV